jgi:hypothetical protein
VNRALRFTPLALAVVAVGLAAAIGFGTLNAVAAQSSAKRFELVFNGRHEPATGGAYPLGWRHTGTFTSSAPFCSSGTGVDLAVDLLDGRDDIRLYTCDDGSGSLTLQHEMFEEHKAPWTNTWRILSGTGRYADLRGEGEYRGEFLSGDPEFTLTVVYRSTFSGFVDFDSVAPTITVSSAKITKLKRPAWTYSLQLRLSVRDNLAGNAVSYAVQVVPEGAEIPAAAKADTTKVSKVDMSFRIRLKGVRAITLQFRAADEVGNTRWSTRRLKMPR